MIRNCLIFAIFAALFLSFPITALAQDSLNVRCLNQYLHNWDNGVQDVCVDGDYAYLACGSDGIRIMNISDPNRIIEIEHYSFDGIYNMVKRGDFLYLGSYMPGLNIIDVSNPLQPNEVQSVAIEGHKVNVKIFGNYAYVCAEYATAGLTIVDISDPHTAHIVSQPADLLEAFDIDVRNDTAFVSAGRQGLWILDISDINAPQFLSAFTNQSGEAVIGVAVSGNYAYLGCVADGLRVIDLSNMQAVGVNDSLIYCDWIEKNNGYLYVEYGIDYYRLATVDISDSLNPVISSSYYPPESIRNFSISGDRAYIADEWHGFRAVDISNPDVMNEIFYENHCGIDFGVVVSGDYAYVRQDYGLAVFDISDIPNPRQIGNFELANFSSDFVVKENIAYILSSHNPALSAIDISNPESPTLLGTFDTQDAVHFFFGIYDHYAYITETDGMRVIDVANPGNMTQVGYYYCSHPKRIQTIYDHYMVYGQDDHSVNIADLTNPLHPEVIQSFYLEEYCYDAKVSGNLLYLVAPSYLWIYDISNWNQISNTYLRDLVWCDAREIEISGNYAYLAGEFCALSILDISNPAAPALAGYYETIYGAYGVALYDNYIILAGLTNLGFYEFTPAEGIGEPSQPAIPNEFALNQNYPNPFNNSTSISYDLPTSADVTIDIYDIAGRHMQTLLSELQTTGHHELIWDSKNATSGVYFYKIRANEFTQTQKMMLMK